MRTGSFVSKFRKWNLKQSEWDFHEKWQ